MASRRKEPPPPAQGNLPARMSPDPREAVRRIARGAQETAQAAPHEAGRRPERADLKE
jgi:hypothetical protein